MKFVLLDDLEKPLAPYVGTTTIDVQETSFSMGASDIEGGARAQLDEPSASRVERLHAHLILAGFASGRRELDVALDHAAKAEALAAGSENPTELTTALLVKGNCLYRKGEFAPAQETYDRALEHASAAEDKAASSGLVPQLLVGLANTHLRLGAFDDAASLYGVAADVERQRGAVVQGVYASVWQGEARRREGKTDAARELWRACLRVADSLGPDLEDAKRSLRAEILERLARLEDAEGHRAEAADLHEHASDCGCDVFVAAEP